MSDTSGKKVEKKVEKKNLTVSEMKEEILALKKKLLGLRIKASSGELANTAEVRNIKKKIAQLLTKINNQNA